MFADDIRLNKEDTFFLVETELTSKDINSLSTSPPSSPSSVTSCCWAASATSKLVSATYCISTSVNYGTRLAVCQTSCSSSSYAPTSLLTDVPSAALRIVVIVSNTYNNTNNINLITEDRTPDFLFIVPQMLTIRLPLPCFRSAPRRATLCC